MHLLSSHTHESSDSASDSTELSHESEEETTDSNAILHSEESKNFASRMNARAQQLLKGIIDEDEAAKAYLRKNAENRKSEPKNPSYSPMPIKNAQGPVHTTEIGADTPVPGEEQVLHSKRGEPSTLDSIPPASPAVQLARNGYVLPPKSGPLPEVLVQLGSGPPRTYFEALDLGTPQVPMVLPKVEHEKVFHLTACPQAESFATHPERMVNLFDVLKKHQTMETPEESFQRQIREYQLSSVDVIEPSHYLSIVENMKYEEDCSARKREQYTKALEVLERIVRTERFRTERAAYLNQYRTMFSREKNTDALTNNLLPGHTNHFDGFHTHEQYEIYQEYTRRFECTILNELVRWVGEDFDDDEFYELLLENPHDLSDEAWEVLLTIRSFETFSEFLLDDAFSSNKKESTGTKRLSGSSTVAIHKMEAIRALRRQAEQKEEI